MEKAPVKQEAKEPELNTQETGRNKQTEQEEEVDIDLRDPEVAAAANKIQATFRGKMARKMFKQKVLWYFI